MTDVNCNADKLNADETFVPEATVNSAPILVPPEPAVNNDEPESISKSSLA